MSEADYHQQRIRDPYLLIRSIYFSQITHPLWFDLGKA